MRIFRNARTRLIAASAVLGCCAIALVLALVYWTVNRIIEAETRNVVNAELVGLADSYDTFGVIGLSLAIDRRIRNQAEPEAVYLLTDRFGEVLAGNLGAWPPTVGVESGWVELDLIRTDSDRVVPIEAATVSLPGGERLLVGRDGSARQRFDRILARSLVLGLMVALIVSVLIGWMLSRLVFSRMSEISDTASEIISGDLTRRIPLRETDDEFDRLGAALNDMLDRIEDLVGNLRMITTSFSHDLRSPLTRLHAHIALLADEKAGASEKAAVSELAAAEIDNLLRTFADLTEIARADARLGKAEFEPFDVSELITNVADLFTPLAAEDGVTISTKTEDISMVGHVALLSRAMANLLENAMRYAPSGSEILVTSQVEDDWLVIAVSDEGAGVPEESLTSIFRPFVTLDDSRTDGKSGLGLALASSAAELHGGTVRATNLHTGFRVEIRLPIKTADLYD